MRTYGGGGPAESLLSLERGNARGFPAMPAVQVPFVRGAVLPKKVSECTYSSYCNLNRRDPNQMHSE